MRQAMNALAAAVTAALAAGCVLAGCSTFLDVLEGRPVANATPGVNLLRNPGFESFKGNAETPFVHDDGKASSRGVAADWVVCPGSQVISTSISKEAAEGRSSQRVDGPAG